MRLLTLTTLACTWLTIGALAAQDAATGTPDPVHVDKTESSAKPKPHASEVPALKAGSLLALLPPAGTLAAVGGESAGTEAVQTVTAALRRMGYRVLSPAQVSARLTGHAPDACRDPATCDPELALATLGADAVVSMAAWQQSSAARQVVVHVRRVRGFGQAEVAVGDAGLRAALSAALSAALDDSQHTHEVAVRIESQPIGANVHVDQTIATRTPANVSLLPGNHLLSVEAAGYVSRAQYIEVPEQTSNPVLYRVQLVAAEIGSKDAPVASAPEAAPVSLELPAPKPEAPYAGAAATQTEPSSWNYVVAIALMSAAVPLFANAIYGASTRGQCIGAIDSHNRCAERVTLGPAFYASLAIGSAALLGGASFLVFQPLTSSSSARPDGALLQWHKTF